MKGTSVKLKFRFLAIVGVLAFMINVGLVSAKDISLTIHEIKAFAEPVISCAQIQNGNERELPKLLTQYAATRNIPELDAIWDWVNTHSESPWTPSLCYNAGTAYYRSGYFTRALEVWRLGWNKGRHFEGPEARIITDANFGELARMLARIGRMEELESLFKDKGNRVLTGPGATIADHAMDGLTSMKLNPGISFKCGPMALASVQKELSHKPGIDPTILEAQSTSAGLSLQEVAELAGSLGMDCVPAKRVSNKLDYPMPSVIHWKLGHYAALVLKDGDRYLIKDPTFGEDLWIKKEAIEREGSGYFLVSSKAINADFKTISSAEAQSIRGRGKAHTSAVDASSHNDKKCKSCKARFGIGMPGYDFFSMLTSLSITDVPIGYDPPYGPSVNFEIDYSQREAYQPAVFDFGNLGPKWISGWQSYVIDDPTTPGVNARVILPGGGSEAQFSWDAGSTSYLSCSYGAARLKRVSSSPIRWERTEPSGWKQIYTQDDGASGYPRRTFITAIADPHGQQIVFNYDGHLRITSINDALGRSTTISYLTNTGTWTTTDYLIHTITDPYGRTATIGYDSSHRVNSITDMWGMSSSFDYDGSSDFVNSMTTPYGTTTFEKEPDGLPVQQRYIQATDPYGERERAQYTNYALLDDTMDPSVLPGSGVTSENAFMNARLSLYWNKAAMKSQSDSCCPTIGGAELTHFLHNSDDQTGRTPDYTKKPLEGYIFYNYPGQWSTAYEGSFNEPSGVARRLDDASTQYTHYDYNTQGNVTGTTDPIGRQTVIEYDATGLNKTKVKKVTGSGVVTVLEVAYDTQHLPNLITNADGTQTSASYNSFGQLFAVRNAKNETTTYDYSTTGLLLRIRSPDSANFTAFSYDAYDRVTSATQFPEGYTLRYDYDIGGRPTKITYPDGTYEEQDWDKLDVTASRDRLGRWTQMTYSKLDQMETITNPAGETVQLDWCSCGALDRVVDAEGRITAYYRDLQNRVTKKELPDLSATNYTYETNTSRLKSQTDAKGQIIHYDYNIDDTLAQQYVSNVASGTFYTPTMAYNWDPYLRRLTGWVDGVSPTYLTYVPFNSADTVYGDGKLESVDGPWGNDTIAYAYDELGRKVYRSINGSANEASVAYDNLGRGTVTTNSLGSFTYDYTPDSDELTKITSSYGHITNFTYKSALEDLHLDAIENLSTTGDLLSRFTYNYDALGRIAQWGQKQEASGSDPTPFTMQYDAADRLTEVLKKDASGAGTQWDWRYDKTANRLNQQIESFTAGSSNVQREYYDVNIADQATTTTSGGPVYFAGHLDEQGKITPAYGTPLVYTDANTSFGAWVNSSGSTNGELQRTDWAGNTTTTQVTFSSGGMATRSMTYDANGNLTQMTVTPVGGSPQTTQYRWDVTNDLVEIEYSDGSISDFVHDRFHRVVWIVELDNTLSVMAYRWLVWDGLQIAEERNDAPDASPNKMFFRQGEVRNGNKFFYTRDHLGSLREVTDDSGYLIAKYEYDPYGKVTQTAGTESFNFLYTGHFYHAVSGLYLAPFRAYDPGTGRWMSRDPMGQKAGLNLYGYLHAYPVNAIDPYGLYDPDDPAHHNSVDGLPPNPYPLPDPSMIGPILLNPTLFGIPLPRNISEGGAKIDTDGGRGNPHHDPDKSKDPHLSDGSCCDPDQVSYATYPYTMRSLCGRPALMYNVSNHRYTIVRARDGRPPKKPGEGSISALNDLGVPWHDSPNPNIGPKTDAEPPIITIIW